MAETGSVKVRIDDDAIKGRMREFLAQAWDEGHKAGGQDAGALTGWAHLTQMPGYSVQPMPKPTSNPYRD